MRLVLTIGLWVQVFALQADTLTLQEVISNTLKGNVPVQIAAHRESQAAAMNSAGAAGMLPSVGIGASQTISQSDIHQQFYTGDDRSTSNAKASNQNAGINASWTFFDGLGMFALKDQLAELERLSGIETRLAVESALSSAMISYYQISLAEHQVDVMDSVLKYSRERTWYARQQMLAGAGSELDYLQSKVDLTADSLSVEQAKVVVKNLKAQLNRIMGQKADSSFQVSRVIPETELLSYASLLESAANGNAGVIRARTAIAIAMLDVKRAQSDRLPELTGIAGYNYSKSASEAGLLQSSRSVGPSVGLSLNYNLFNGSAVNRAVRIAELETRISELDYRFAMLSLEENLYTTFNDFMLARTRVGVELQRFEQARHNMRIAKATYEAGALSLLGFREYQEQFLEAGAAYYSALFEARRNEILLRQISGTLTE